MQRAHHTFLLTIVVASCAGPNYVSDSSDLEVKITTSKIIFEKGEAIPLTIKLTNLARHAVLLPAKASYSSDLYPNGIAPEQRGISVHFSLRPMLPFPTFIEDIIVLHDENFERLESGESMEYSHDFGEHLESHWEELESGAYEIAAVITYAPAWKVPRNTWRGSAESNTVVLEIRESAS